MNYPVLVWWLALAVCVALSTATSPKTNVTEDNSTTWAYVPDENGNPYVVYLNESLASGDTWNNPTKISVELYNRKNRFRDSGVKAYYFIFHEIIFYHEKATLRLINAFDAQLDTKMLVHGFQSSAREGYFKSIRKEYNKRGNFNFIAIDWRIRAGMPLLLYEYSANYVPEVGWAVARLIKLLVMSKGADSKRIHLIGHSLGAHVMGNAGYHFNKMTGKYVGRITGLDPAGPLFEARKPIAKHLEAADAHFVDVIHTATRKIPMNLGYIRPIGDVDFYPNVDSLTQPGCYRYRKIHYWLRKFLSFFDFRINDNIDFSCSHKLAYKYFAESINSKRGFYSVPCSNLEAAQKGKCFGKQILMGDPVPVNASGIYYLKTNKQSYFAKGKHT